MDPCKLSSLQESGRAVRESERPLPEAVLFDFNGVIVDDEWLHGECFAEIVRANGFAFGPEDYFSDYFGLTDSDFFRDFYRDQDTKLTERAVQRLVADKAALYCTKLDLVSMIPGSDTAVREISSKVPIIVVSGALRQEITTLLGRFGLLDCFAGIVAAEDVRAGKPSPEGYLRGLELLNRHPGRCLAIEDSPLGIQAARHAGLRCWAVTTSRPASILGDAHRLLDSLEGVDYDELGRWMNSVGAATAERGPMEVSPVGQPPVAP